MTTRSKAEFRYTGTHLDDLADGHLLEPGLVYELTQAEQEDPHNRSRIDDGLLVPVKADTAKEGNS